MAPRREEAGYKHTRTAVVSWCNHVGCVTGKTSVLPLLTGPTRTRKPQALGAIMLANVSSGVKLVCENCWNLRSFKNNSSGVYQGIVRKMAYILQYT